MRHLLLMVALALTTLACSSGDDTGSDDADASTPGTATSAGDNAEFVLTSPAFNEGDPIPDRFSSLSDNISPPLEWSGPPSGTVQFALTVVDPDASNFIHWILVDLSPGTDEIPEGSTPAGAVDGRNQFGEIGWGGPAPPAGETHTYVFTLHALSAEPGVDASTPAAEAMAAINNVTIATAVLSGTFTSD